MEAVAAYASQYSTRKKFISAGILRLDALIPASGVVYNMEIAT